MTVGVTRVIFDFSDSDFTTPSLRWNLRGKGHRADFWLNKSVAHQSNKVSLFCVYSFVLGSLFGSDTFFYSTCWCQQLIFELLYFGVPSL
jgi:hypothetical protein